MVEESEGCPKIKHEEEDDEEEKEAPVDKEINDGGYNAVKEDLETLKREYAKLIAEQILAEADKECDDKDENQGDEVETESEDAAEEKKVDESEDNELSEALYTLLEMVKEAQARSQAIMEDFEALKEEYAKLVAEQIVAEAETKEQTKDSDKAEEKNAEEHEEAVKAGAEDEEAKQDEEKGEKADAKEEEKEADKEADKMRKDEHEEKKDYDEAHCDKCESDETADKIAEDVASISEGVEEKVEVKVPQFRTKAYSVFSSISESVEAKPTRKAHTVFPNL
jgi:hypothetical protein